MHAHVEMVSDVALLREPPATVTRLRDARRPRRRPRRRHPHLDRRRRLAAQLPGPGRRRPAARRGQRLQHRRPDPGGAERVVRLPARAARAPAHHAAVLVTCAVGAVGGALLLLALPPGVFEAVVPWLILFTCLLVGVQPWITRWLRARRGADRPDRVHDVAGHDLLRHPDRGVRRLLRRRLGRDDGGRPRARARHRPADRQRPQDPRRDAGQRRRRRSSSCSSPTSTGPRSGCSRPGRWSAATSARASAAGCRRRCSGCWS